jgi:membrane-bound serine protease (ClpP class)
MLLTMRTDRAMDYGFAVAELSNHAELKSHFGVNGAITVIESTWIEASVDWLASPLVRSVMFMFILLGAYIEMQTPGFGIAGGFALVLLVIFLGAPYVAGYTVTWEILAIILGLALLAVEAFVIPGFGVAGISGIILLMVGLLASFVPSEPSFDPNWFRLPTYPMTTDAIKNGIYSLGGGMGAAIVGMVVLARYLPRMPIANRIIVANPTPADLMPNDPYDGAAQMGDLGKAETLLRPAGKARFGATLVDVVTEGEYIDAGSRIEVVERYGNRVVVRRVD